MNVRIEHIKSGEDEIVIKCKEVNEAIKGILNFINSKKKILGELEGKKYLLSPLQIYYCESVDNVVYIYTKNNVYRSILTLRELEDNYELFRCSKSMVINISAILNLKSEVGNRIDATLKNGEHIIISRRYAKELRNLLKSKMRGDD